MSVSDGLSLARHYITLAFSDKESCGSYCIFPVDLFSQSPGTELYTISKFLAIISK